MTATVNELPLNVTGQDRFQVVVAGKVITTHPTLRGATKLAARYNETGAL